MNLNHHVISSNIAILPLVSPTLEIGLVRARDVERARSLVATGMIAGLSFKLAGTFLKLLQLHTWQHIAMLTALWMLRTVLKQFFVWEQTQLKRE